MPKYPVALVCMPFFVAERPSIQLGLLHAIAARQGFPVESHHLNLDLSKRLGSQNYHALCSHRRHMTGEWLFSHAAFGDAAASEEQYFARFPDEVRWAERELSGGADYLTRLRREVLPEFIDHCASMAWNEYRAVGFTSTFQQNVASIALARRIKEAWPEVLTVFGGANFEDEMGPEYVRTFPCIDLAVVGEADAAFPLLLEKLAAGEDPGTVPGVTRRCGRRVTVTPPAGPTVDLDGLPTPHYDEYFARQMTLEIEPAETWSVPFETSRGCWWGKKHHCTFCGLNGTGMAFRSKRPARVLAELAELSARHRITFFEATDNILDMQYVDTLFDSLRQQHLDYQFFYEVKSNLTKEQIGKLCDGGVRWVQPGIESLSTPVLKLMRKGTTMLQNVRMLKWCRYFGVRVSWNLLWGFPGERLEFYADELTVLKTISHLEPPGGCGRIWLERFSPYFFDRDVFKATNVQPEASYAYAYPDGIDLQKAAYFFDYDFADTLPDETHRATGELISAWRVRAGTSTSRADYLRYRRTGSVLLIDDHRAGWPIGTHTFTGPVADLYLFCDETARSAPDVTAHLRAAGHEVTIDDVRTTLHGFVERGLMVSEGDRFFSLALPSQPRR